MEQNKLTPNDQLTGIKKLFDLSSFDHGLLTQACVHRSYLNEHPDFPYTSNERLEFLGDSVLSIIVSEYLYERFPKQPEGYLTTVRSAVVSKKTLARIAKELELGNFLFLARGEEESGGRANPSILANTLEALIGAIYLDQGLKTVKRVVLPLLASTIAAVTEEGAYQDYKSVLQERTQNIGLGPPFYKLLHSKGPDHAKQFEVGVYVKGKLYGKGRGASKQAAEQEAAKLGLSSLI